MRETEPAGSGSPDHSPLLGGSSSSNPTHSHTPSDSRKGGRVSEQTEVPVRHVDAGPLVPVDEGGSGREDDMELPPAYGEQTGVGRNTHHQNL